MKCLYACISVFHNDNYMEGAYKIRTELNMFIRPFFRDMCLSRFGVCAEVLCIGSVTLQFSSP